MNHFRPIVYIASPYTKGDPCVNARFQMEIFNELLGDGYVLPYAPLVSHFQHTMFPRDYQEWIDYDKEMIHACNFAACLRLNVQYQWPSGKPYFESESSGADGEVLLFKQLGKPVFYNKPDLYDWARSLVGLIS